MPIYLYNCGKCKETREYFLNQGQEPFRCEGCDETDGPFTRVYHGQTLSMQLDSERSGEETRKEVRKLEVVAQLPLLASCGHQVATAIIVKDKKKD